MVLEKVQHPMIRRELLEFGEATKAQMATDVAAFLTWTAEPKLEARHAGGVASVVFLLILSILAYMSYQSIWANKEH